MTTELPPKPKHGSPCNGCGLCCALEVCNAGEIAYQTTTAPCPGLKIAPDGKRTYCELVVTEITHKMPPILQNLLGIGHGCSMSDDYERFKLEP